MQLNVNNIFHMVCAKKEHMINDWIKGIWAEDKRRRINWNCRYTHVNIQINDSKQRVFAFYPQQKKTCAIYEAIDSTAFYLFFLPLIHSVDGVHWLQALIQLVTDIKS